MILSERRYTGPDDLDAMAGLARRYAGDHLHVIDLPYRFSSWAFDEPENIHLWFNPERHLQAWAALQTPFWTVDITCLPDAETSLFAPILAWADQRARTAASTPDGRPAWYVNVFDDQPARIHALDEAGFTCQSDVGEDSWSNVFLHRAGPAPLKAYPPPAGFTVRSLAGENEVEAYVELHQSVFESKNMTSEWRSRTLRQPAYRRELDMVVEAPDGRLAAFCIGWLDRDREGHWNGQIEPLGCHKNFRQFALGRVAFAEVLQRLQALGAQDIYVETDNYRNSAFRLYRSFDFQVARNVLVFRKDYGPAAGAE